MTYSEEIRFSKDRRLCIPNSFYHAFNRGNRKQNIFFDEEDYLKFLQIIRYHEVNTTVEIYGYCLMPNHYHLLLRLGSDIRDFSKFFHRSMTGYSVYFNKKYNLVGRLCQDRYQYRLLRNGADIECIKEYLRTNPVKARLVRKRCDYRWLSIYDG